MPRGSPCWTGWFQDGASAEMRAAVAGVAAGLGATARAVLPEAKRARAAAFCISAFEGGQLHKENLRTRPQDFDPATRPRLLAGALQPAETIYQAQRFRAWFRAAGGKSCCNVRLAAGTGQPLRRPVARAENHAA